jgi:hypothetical protein
VALTDEPEVPLLGLDWHPVLSATRHPNVSFRSVRPVYVVIGVTVNGERDILGLWAGDGGEG